MRHHWWRICPLLRLGIAMEFEETDVFEKAANPGCVVEDFIRWYSPRDFIEADEEIDASEEAVPNVKGEI